MRVTSCPRTFLRSGKGSTPTSIPRGHVADTVTLDHQHSRRSPLGLAAELPPACVQHVHDLAQWSTATTSSPRINGLPSVPTLIWWIILFGATSRHIPIDRRPHSTKARLIASIKENIAPLLRDLEIKTCFRVRGHIETKSDYIETDDQCNFRFLFEIKLLKITDFLLFLLFLSQRAPILSSSPVVGLPCKVVSTN